MQRKKKTIKCEHSFKLVEILGHHTWYCKKCHRVKNSYDDSVMIYEGKIKINAMQKENN